MANIAGYRAVVEAAHAFGRFFTGQVTAAGKVPPAKVLVARRRCRRPGRDRRGRAAWARSCARPTRVPRSPTRCRSLGGEYLSVEAADVEVSATGYAKEMSEDYNARAAALYAEQADGRRHHHHDRADPGPPGADADHRRDGRLDEARQRDRRHGRRQRRQRRGHGRRRGGRRPTTASRSSATPTSPGGCRRRPRSSTAPTWST